MPTQRDSSAHRAARRKFQEIEADYEARVQRQAESGRAVHGFSLPMAELRVKMLRAKILAEQGDAAWSASAPDARTLREFAIAEIALARDVFAAAVMPPGPAIAGFDTASLAAYRDAVLSHAAACEAVTASTKAAHARLAAALHAVHSATELARRAREAAEEPRLGYLLPHAPHANFGASHWVPSNAAECVKCIDAITARAEQEPEIPSAEIFEIKSLEKQIAEEKRKAGLDDLKSSTMAALASR